MVSTTKKITINEGAAYWAKITGAPRPHRSTLLRWVLKGCRGQRLRAEPLAGRWYTTKADIEDFLRHVTAMPATAVDPAVGPVRAAQVQQALADLDELTAPQRPRRRKAK